MAEVVVVGAGFAGLSAARRLRELGVENLVVVEARPRVGGRTKPGRIAGVDIDLGGMWVGPTQTRLTELAETYGVESYPTWLGGKCVARLAGNELHGPGEDIDDVLSAADKVQYLWIQRRMRADPGRSGVALHPRLEGHGVELGGTGVPPRGLDVQVAAQRSHPALDPQVLDL
ncbi:MAG: FAD-dependent oxidoreductase, partial [Actinomycetota bacterium]